MIMDSVVIYRELRRRFSNHLHHFENKYIFRYNWECDYFCISKSNYIIEIEVKVSKSDFKADFLKPKHKVLALRNGEKCPNKFYFACPENLISVNEIPAYAGLIYVTDTWSRIIKNAPFIHKDKLNIEPLLFSKYYYDNINNRNKIYEMQRCINRLCEIKGINPKDHSYIFK